MANVIGDDATLMELPPGLTDRELRELMVKYLERTHNSLERWIPDDLRYATFPEDGGFQPLAAGTTVFDLKTGRVDAPNGRFKYSSESFDLTRIQSAFILVDSWVSLKAEPGVGVAVLALSTPVFAVGRHVERFELTADVPYMCLMVLSPFPFPVNVDYLMACQYRVTDTTLTKKTVANTADTWTELLWTPETLAIGAQTRWMDQAAFGRANLAPYGAGLRSLTIRNLSTANALHVRVQGMLNPRTGLGLELAAPGFGWVLDPEIHEPGTQSASYVTVPVASIVQLETSTPWQLMRVQGRVAGAAAAGQTARTVSDFCAQAPGVR